MILIVDSLDGSLDACVNNGNVNLLICQHESVKISVKSGSFHSTAVKQYFLKIKLDLTRNKLV